MFAPGPSGLDRSRSSSMTLILLVPRFGTAWGIPPHASSSRRSKRVLAFAKRACVAVDDACCRPVGGKVSERDGNAPVLPKDWVVQKQTRRKGARGRRGRARVERRRAVRLEAKERAAMQRSLRPLPTSRVERSPPPPSEREFGYLYGRTCPAGCRRPKSPGGHVRCVHNWRRLISSYDVPRVPIEQAGRGARVPLRVPRGPRTSLRGAPLSLREQGVQAVAQALLREGGRGRSRGRPGRSFAPTGPPRGSSRMPRGMPSGLDLSGRLRWLAENSDRL